MAGHPRVLTVGQPFDRTSGGGITLNNLFQGWPSDSLAAVVVSDRDLAFDVCEHYYALGRDEITWSWPLSLVGRTETPASVADVAPKNPGPTSLIPSAGLPPTAGLAKRAFRGAIDGLGVEGGLRRMHLSDRLRAWIADFRPEVVYSQLSDLPVMTLVSEILADTGAPFALHIMDDWPSSMYRHGALAGVVRAQAERSFAHLLEHSAVRMAIGDAMADEYRRRYSADFVPIQNSVDVARQDELAAAFGAEFAPAPGTPIRVVYAGRIGRANAQSLLDTAEAVSAMARDGADIGLLLYTGSADHPFVACMAALPGVSVLPAVPYDHVPALIASADILLLPLDFDDEATLFARLSMPTKIPEYMAAGRPVLTYAPRGSAAAEYARAGGWSLLVDARDPSQLRSALTALAADRGVREAMGAAGRSLALERHDAVKVRARFAQELGRAASPAVGARGNA